MDFQANVLAQERISNPKRGKTGANGNHKVDIRKMREGGDEYAVEDGADFDLKLPNNTFNKLFSPPTEDGQSLKMLKNFSFVNKDAS